MLHLYDRATMARALTLDLDPRLHVLLTAHIDALATDSYDLTDDTEILILEPGDDEAGIVRHVGFSPLVEPIDGIRFGQPGFHAFWDWLIMHDGWFEMIVTFGSTFAYVLFIPTDPEASHGLTALCHEFAAISNGSRPSSP